MRKITGVFLGLALTAGSGLAADDPRGLIAFDDCYLDWDHEPYIFCDIFVANADGSGTVLVAADGINPVWSPDGSKIAYFGRGDGDIHLLNLGDGTNTRIITPLDQETTMAWSPEGTKIAFLNLDPNAAWGLYVMNEDGSGRSRLGNASGPDGGPSWAPDGDRIAFNCSLDFPNTDICTIEPDGTGLVRLTAHAEFDGGPAFSPDGSRIAFVTYRYGGSSPSAIAVMNSDGSGVTRVGTVNGHWPDWSFDGSRIAYAAPFVGSCEGDDICYPTVHVMNADGSADRGLRRGSNPSWRHSAQPLGPFAIFTPSCAALHCDVDGSGSWDPDGTIASFHWDFGDGATGAGVTAAHTYAGVGPYVITLTVTDDNGLVGTASRTVLAPPVASFVASCFELTCDFDGSASYDPGGVIVHYEWSFGDGSVGFDRITSHTYAWPDTWVVTLTVRDKDGLEATHSEFVTTFLTYSHVGDLDGSAGAAPGASSQLGTWTAFVTINVHHSGHGPVANAVVTGSWSGGAPGACTTDAAGVCKVIRSSIPQRVPSMTFTIGAVAHPELAYAATGNHDPDGDSDGSSIVVTRP